MTAQLAVLFEALLICSANQPRSPTAARRFLAWRVEAAAHTRKTRRSVDGWLWKLMSRARISCVVGVSIGDFDDRAQRDAGIGAVVRRAHAG